MKQILFCAVAAIIFTSCEKEAPRPLTKQQIQQQIDSIAAKKCAEVDNRARIDLERRIKIEVKVKADSIRQAMSAPQTVDSTKK